MLTDLDEKEFAVEEVGQLNEPLLHGLSPTLGHIQISPQWRLLVARKENALNIGPIVQEGDP